VILLTKYLVVYDISDDSTRNKLADELFRLGLTRIQRSAFAGDLDPQRAKDLVRVLSRYISSDRDVIHVFRLGIRDWENRVVIGREWGAGSVSKTIIL